MNRRIREKVMMYSLVQKTAEEFHTVWENTPKFAQAMTLFNSRLELLSLAIEQKRLYTLGVTKKRNLYKDEVIKIAYDVSSALKVLAAELVDPELAARVNYTKSQLKRATLLDLVGLLDTIIQLADEYAPALTEYGVSPEMIEDFHTKRDALSVVILSPKQAILNRKNETKTVIDLTKEIDDILKVKIDRLVQMFATSNPVFYNKFQNARKVTTVVYHTGSDVAPPEVDDGN